MKQQNSVVSLRWYLRKAVLEIIHNLESEEIDFSKLEQDLEGHINHYQMNLFANAHVRAYANKVIFRLTTCLMGCVPS